MPMVATIIEYAYDPARLDQLAAVLPAAERLLLDVFEQQPGFIESLTLDHGDGRCTRLTVWASPAAAEAAAVEHNAQVREVVMQRFRPQIQPLIAAAPVHSQATVVCQGRSRGGARGG